MKTADFVVLLATGEPPVRPHATTRRLAMALAGGLAVSFAIVGLGYRFRPDLAQAVFWPMFWIKLAVLLTIGAAGLLVTHRLARPGAKPGAAWLGLALPLAAIWLLALVSLVQAPPQARLPLVLGETWRSCIFNILLVSAPLLAAGLSALRTLAPTRPAMAGAAVGALAGGLGASVYALHCPELAAPFLAIWYVAGVAATVGVGALLGPRLLRW